MTKLNKIFGLLLGLSQKTKTIILCLTDSILCVLAVYLAYLLRLGHLEISNDQALKVILLSIGLAISIFYISGTYREILRYNGIASSKRIILATLAYTVIFSFFVIHVGIDGVPRTIGLIQPILLFLLMLAVRVYARVFLTYYVLLSREKSSDFRSLIYGAGETGRQLCEALSKKKGQNVIGFLDDARSLQGRKLNGFDVYDPDDLCELVKRYSVDRVILAMPNIGGHVRRSLIEKIRAATVSVMTVPNITELSKAEGKVFDVKDLDIEDLLGREKVRPNADLLKRTILNKVVLVSGAGGSIGSELCRQIVSLGPAKLLLIEHSEYALYELNRELTENVEGVEIVPLLVSVIDNVKINEILNVWRPDTIFHAAAYKHVPIVEYNVAVGLHNNVFGTLNLAQAAINNGASNFVLISTDKAVRPTNVMGASKRISELILQSLSKSQKHVVFSMVRFGNVLGSSGSVVPIFRQQIANGGPLTITHSEITRYFMMTTEAAQLVIQSGSMAHGGDIFVLDMGQPVKIIDLAKRMIQLSGCTVRDASNPDGDIEVRVTNLRPGEKLYEELLIGKNNEHTEHPRIMRAYEPSISWKELKNALAILEHAINDNDILLINKIVAELVMGYPLEKKSVDLLHCNKKNNAEFI